MDGLCGPFDDWFDGEDDEFDDLFIISIDRVYFCPITLFMDKEVLRVT